MEIELKSNPNHRSLKLIPFIKWWYSGGLFLCFVPCSNSSFFCSTDDVMSAARQLKWVYRPQQKHEHNYIE